jgi:hypothetical protein
MQMPSIIDPFTTKLLLVCATEKYANNWTGSLQQAVHSIFVLNGETLIKKSEVSVWHGKISE